MRSDQIGPVLWLVAFVGSIGISALWSSQYLWSLRFAGPVHGATLYGLTAVFNTAVATPYMAFLGHVCVVDENYVLMLASQLTSSLVGCTLIGCMYQADKYLPHWPEVAGEK